MPAAYVNSLIRSIRSGKITSWDDLHDFYNKKSNSYTADKRQHAFAALLDILKLSPAKFTKKLFIQLLQQAIATKEWMTNGIYTSRAKDYQNPFRQMVYETEQEMEKVIGKLKDNSFIQQQEQEMAAFRNQVEKIIITLG